MSEAQDTKDMVAIASFRGGITRCPGERLVPEGYVCIHCGHDYTLDRKCGARKARTALAKVEA